MVVKHPAKYSNSILPILAEQVTGRHRLLDVFAGTCKISEIKKMGFTGEIYCNEIEPEWASLGLGNVDHITTCDAESLPYKDSFFDAVCTSPTYGNRMADSHNAKDKSVRNTYTHKIGRKLSEGNTGGMQWGKKYREKHDKIWGEVFRVLNEDGILVVNISDHIRKGEVVPVTDWHIHSITSKEFELVNRIDVETPRQRFGANGNARVPFEHVLVFKKTVCGGVINGEASK